MSKQADFFLASSESYAFRGPFSCWVEATVTGEVRSDYLLVRIEPPAIDFRTKEQLEKILIAGRNKPINLRQLPASVYIANIKDPSVYTTHKCNASNIEVVTTGDAFPTLKEAEEFAKSVT